MSVWHLVAWAGAGIFFVVWGVFALSMIGGVAGWLLGHFGWVGPTERRRAALAGRAPEAQGDWRDLLRLVRHDWPPLLLIALTLVWLLTKVL